MLRFSSRLRFLMARAGVRRATEDLPYSYARRFDARYFALGTPGTTCRSRSFGSLQMESGADGLSLKCARFGSPMSHPIPSDLTTGTPTESGCFSFKSEVNLPTGSDTL